MQKTVEYTVNNRVSPATIELLIRERSKGKSLRQLGQMFNTSHERIRKLLAKYDQSQVRLLSETTIAAKLGYPVSWLTKLRKEGIIKPIKPGGFWLYSEEQVRQIPPLIDETRKCEQCGKPRPVGYPRFCRECSQYREKHRFKTLSPEKKAEHVKRCLVWRKANPEKAKEMLSRAHRKFRAKYFERTSYLVSCGNYLPLGTTVKVRAAGSNGTVAILNSDFEIPFRCLRKVSRKCRATQEKGASHVKGENQRL